jgi:thiamine pyrophosphokinase
MSGQTNDKRVLVITGGSVLLTAPPLGPFDIVIAADSGVDSAFALGLAPHVVIGDLDSVSDAGLRRVREAGIDLLAAATDKDLTDTELALAHLLDIDATHATLLSPGGGRLDHAHGLLTALASPLLASVSIDAVIDTAHVTVLHGRTTRRIPNRSELTALHAMNGLACGITTTGFRWNLTGEDLAPWVSRGVSNEMVEAEAAVVVDAGTLIVVQPCAYLPRAHPPSTGETR